MNKCEYCGTRLNFNETKCPSCGANINVDYKKIINENLNKNKNKDNYNLHLVACLLIIISSIIIFFIIHDMIEFDRGWNDTIDSSLFFDMSYSRKPVELFSTIAAIYFLYRFIILITVIIFRIKKIHFSLAFSLVVLFTVSITAGGVCFADYSNNEN